MFTTSDIGKALDEHRHQDAIAIGLSILEDNEEPDDEAVGLLMYTYSLMGRPDKAESLAKSYPHGRAVTVELLRVASMRGDWKTASALAQKAEFTRGEYRTNLLPARTGRSHNGARQRGRYGL